MATQFKVTNFSCVLENSLGHLVVKEEDDPEKVRYEGPFFYCDATVSCVIDDDKDWYIGFVQSCDAIYLRHTYESGNYTQWEFPTPISDANKKSFPYYHCWSPKKSGRRAQPGEGMEILEGPIERSEHYTEQLSMNDNLSSNVQWWDPVPAGQENYDPAFAHTLKKIERKQKFSAFVVASRGKLTSYLKYSVLAKVIWQSHFIIDFDCDNWAGLRSNKRFGDGHKILYRKTNAAAKFEKCIFINQNANDKQQLVGYLANGTKAKPKIKW